MSFFQQIEGEGCILMLAGTFYQTTLWARDGYLYAKHGAGWVRLMADGATSKAKLRLDFMTLPTPPCRDALGRLCMPTVAGAKPLTPEHAVRLLGQA
jgi:hypothetical protein